MLRPVKYTLLFICTVLLQVFFFDRLTLSVFFAPMIYTVFIILLPINTSSVLTLTCGLITGITMDIAMGTAGLNTIATLAIAYVRHPLLFFLVGREGVRDASAPSPDRMGRRQFVKYLVVMVVVHSAVFSLIEVFSTSHIIYTLLRFVISTSASLIFVRLIIQLFTYKSTSKI